MGSLKSVLQLASCEALSIAQTRSGKPKSTDDARARLRVRRAQIPRIPSVNSFRTDPLTARQGGPIWDGSGCRR